MRMKVEMDDIGILSVQSGDEILKTNGISTCICLMLKGTFLDKNFILMHHWSGFVNHKTHPKRAMESLVSRYNMALDDYFENDSDEFIKPLIVDVSIIGGQEKQLNDEGELLCSGTSAEIKAIQQLFLETLQEEFSLHVNLKTQFKPFVTKDEESLTVSFNAKGQTSYRFDGEPQYTTEFSI